MSNERLRERYEEIEAEVAALPDDALRNHLETRLLELAIAEADANTNRSRFNELSAACFWFERDPSEKHRERMARARA